MPKKPDPTPEAPAAPIDPTADGFVIRRQPSAPGEPPAANSEEEERLWTELRAVLGDLVNRPAQEKDREKVYGLLERLGLARECAALFVTALREERQLAEVQTAGEGCEARCGLISREATDLTHIQPATPEAAVELATRKEALRIEYAENRQKANAAERARSGRRWLRTWLHVLFEGEPRPRSDGALGSFSLLAPATVAIAGRIGVKFDDFYKLDSWRNLRQPDAPPPPRRRFTTKPLSGPPPSLTTLGQRPQTRF